jgi:hypothetical protein
MKTTIPLTKSSFTLAKYSFIIGTLLFIGCLVANHNMLVTIGAFYLITALTINALYFIALFVAAFIYRDKAFEIIDTMLIMLANIPIALCYTWAVTSFII